MRHLLLLLLALALLVPASAGAQAADPTPATGYGSVPFSNGPLKGNVTFRLFSASDVDGIFSTWFDVDGVRVLEYDETCLSNGLACQTAVSDVAFPVDLRRFTDGAHTFAMGVTDGDGRDSAVLARVLSVDNTAPGAPVPTGPLAFTTTETYARLSWQPPANETGPVSVRKLVACDAKSCRALRPFDSVQLALGVTRVSVALADQAGNFDERNATTWTITRVPAARVDPGLRIELAAASRNRRTVTVGGTLAVPHTNHVSVSVRARYGRRTRTVKTIATTSGHGFRTVLRLPSARWRSATVVARVAGTSRYLTVEKRRAVRRAR